jgi:hypothetical protein
VSKTLGKGYFTLGKAFAECPKKVLGKLRIEKNIKTAKHFLKL